MRIHFISFLLSGFVFSQMAYAGGEDFDAIWSSIEERSPSLKSEANENAAADVQVSRAKGHWVPRLSLNAGIVSTDDPGKALFSNLGSRSLQATDLSPSLMNHPSREWVKSGSALIDWSLFEGGAKQSVVRGAKLLKESQVLSLAARKKELYSELVRDFGKLASLNAEQFGVQELQEKLSRLVERYKVGSRDNPVGYSGLLGMRSLINRLDSVLAQNEAQVAALVESIRIHSGVASIESRALLKSEPIEFVKQKFNKANHGEQGTNLRISSMQRMAMAQSEYSRAERARWLPRVGLFASKSLVSGPRDTGISTDYGGYLQWELFNASNRGAYREASLRSSAFTNRSDAMVEESAIARLNLNRSIPMLDGNLNRIRESMKITNEQVLVTEKLFKNGSVNALQLAEVLSRRADVIENKKQIEMALLDQLTEAFLQNASAP